MKNKGIINGVLWLAGMLVFVKFMYKDISMVAFVFGLLFILSIIWFIVSLIEIFYGVRYYLKSHQWNYFSATQWGGYLSSIPLLILTSLLYMNYLKTLLGN
jgi:hypothetical protein